MAKMKDLINGRRWLDVITFKDGTTRDVRFVAGHRQLIDNFIKYSAPDTSLLVSLDMVQTIETGPYCEDQDDA